MSRCLRCGAGNEWIEPIGKECGHEAELAALRAEIKRLNEISEAFREHETLKLPEAGMRYLERIVAVEPKAGVCSSLPHAIRVLCDEHTALRTALDVAEEMAKLLTTKCQYTLHSDKASLLAARFHAARKVGK